MKKSLLAFAVLGTLAGVASAQSSVTMYGLLDTGISYEGSGPSATTAGGYKLSMESGISQPSHLGFRGTEELGGGLKALFQLEAGVQINDGQSTQTGTLFNRASWVGLSGDFGTVTAGRQFTPLYNALKFIDPFEIGMAGNANNLMNVGGANFNGLIPVGGNNVANGGGSMWQNNSLHYVSQSQNGLSAEVNYGFGGQAGNDGGGTEIGATANYINGPLTLLVAYDGVNAIDNSNKFKTTLLGGDINWSQFGFPLKTSLGYAVNKGSDIIGGSNVNSADLILGTRVPFGSHEILFSYIHKEDKTMLDHNSNQFALGYTYAFTKSTSFYSSVAKIIDKNDADYTVGNASNTGYGIKALDLGIRHAF